VSHIKRPFTVAANALAELLSPDAELRVRLHLEIAKCELQEDNLTSARQHVNAALALDYVGEDAEVHQYRHRRPLDRHLQPLLQVINARSGHVQPDASALVCAQVHIEQARSALSETGARRCLEKAALALKDAMHKLPEDAMQASKDRRTDEGYFAARSTCIAWADLIDVASQKQLHQIVLSASSSLTQFKWTSDDDPEMMKLQVLQSFHGCKY
jgi:hypothetical protein